MDLIGINHKKQLFTNKQELQECLALVQCFVVFFHFGFPLFKGLLKLGHPGYQEAREDLRGRGRHLPRESAELNLG